LSSDEEKLDSAIPQIMEVIRKNWKDNPAYSNLRLLIITPNQWLRDYNGDMKLHFEVREFGSMDGLQKEVISKQGYSDCFYFLRRQMSLNKSYRERVFITT
jgi:hypothetical protein